MRRIVSGPIDHIRRQYEFTFTKTEAGIRISMNMPLRGRNDGYLLPN